MSARRHFPCAGSGSDQHNTHGPTAKATAGDRIIVKSAKYCIDFTDHAGVRQTITGTADLESTKRIAAKHEATAAEYRHGSRNHQAEFIAVLDGRRCTTKQIGNTLSYIKAICTACRFTTPANLDAAKVAAHTGDLHRAGRSASNINHKLTALKSFTRWLHRNGRIAHDPMVQVSKLNERTDRRHVHRAFAVDEFSRLANAAVAGPVVRGMTGPDRAMCYRLAVETGLRASELGSLTPRPF